MLFCGLVFEPGGEIFAIVELHGIFSELQGLECIDHHCQLARFFLSDAALIRPWVWTMWNPTRMQRDVSWADVVATHEVPIHIIKHLIRVDVGVIVRRWDGLGVVVVQTRAEGADDKSRCLEGLVDGRWLVDPAGDGFKVVDGKSVGEVVTIPANHIEGMGSVDHFV